MSSDSTVSIGVSTKPQVRFSTLEIREHPIVLGYNPSTLRGPPVEIDWTCQSSRRLDLESYESERALKRRSEKELVMSVTMRVNR